MSSRPIDNLELRALEERTQLHKRADELRGKIEAEKERLNPELQVRKHFLGASLFASIIGLALGYSLAGIFKRN